jgi:hypothetical protein
MRKLEASAFSAMKQPVPAAGRNEVAVRLVCLALTVALVALACRIFSVW